MKENKQLKTGILFALIAALISGISIFYNKQVVVSGIDPVVFNIIKNGGVALILSLLLLRGRNRFEISRLILDKKLIFIGVIGGSIPFVLFFQGLAHVPAINANLIQKTLFIWVAIGAIPLLKEKINPLQIIGYLLVIFGNFFIGGLRGFSFSSYEGMILLATLFWSAEIIIAKTVLRNTSSESVAWGRMFFGSLVLILIAVFTGKIQTVTNLSVNQAAPIMGSITLLTLYVLTLYRALKIAPATAVTSILVLATLVTNILSTIFITHKINNLLNFNSAAILSGVFLISLGYQWRKKLTV